MTSDFTAETFRQAHDRVRDRIHRTPLMTATLLGERLGVRLALKCENLQKTGSFKVRGVLNRLLRLTSEERERGVITISAGNHAQALAWGSRAAGLDCAVVMPADAPRAKAEASRGYGARVILHGDVFEAFQKALDLAEEEGRTFVHPFDDPHIVAGQGTVALELLEQAPEATAIVVPVGGGGLISGIATATRLLRPDIRVYGVEPEGAAAMRASLDRGRPVRLERLETIADGLAAPMAGELTYELVSRHVAEVVTVSDDQIRRAVGELLSWTKLLAEPAGAAGLAAVRAGALPLEPDEGVVCVLSGGNVDLSRLAEMLAEGD